MNSNLSIPILLVRYFFLCFFLISNTLANNNSQTQGECSPILSKIGGNVSIVCSDPNAIKAVESLIKRVEKLSLNAEENRKFIQAQVISIEQLLHKKANANDPKVYDKALEGYARGDIQLFTELLKELKKNKVDELFSEKSDYIEWPEITSKRRYILSSFVNDASCPDDNGVGKSIIKIKIVNGKVNMTVDKHPFKANLSNDRKRISVSAKHSDGDGNTQISGEARIRGNGTIEGEFSWVWVDNNDSYKCTGTTILTSIDR